MNGPLFPKSATLRKIKPMHCRKSISIGLSLSLFCWLAPVNAQQVNEYNLAAMLQKGQLITTPANQTKALENSLPGAVSTKGMVWLKDMAFKQGTIDIDLRGKNVFLQSFLGIAFHGTDSSAYDLVYFRPFNFRYPDTARRRWSVQYVSEPDFSWNIPWCMKTPLHPFPNLTNGFMPPSMSKMAG